MLSYPEFEKNGGYTIGIGAGVKLFTLRTEFWDTIGVPEGPYGQKTSKKIRRSYHVRNLGKNWPEVVEKLPKVLNGAGIFIPGYAQGTLDPNMPPDHTVPKSFAFGKYKGMTIEQVAEVDLGYLLWVATEFKVNPKSKPKLYRFIQRIREVLGDDLDAFIAKKTKEAEEQEKKRKQSEANAKLLLNDVLKVLKYAAARYHEYKGEDTSSPVWEERFEDGLYSDFLTSIYNDMKRGNMPRGRGMSIVRDIYAQNHTMSGKRHRRGSKIYKTGEANFDAMMKTFDPKYDS